jgi:uncharacterized protein
MNVHHRQDESGGEFFVENEGELGGEALAELSYSIDRALGVMVIRHTRVDDSLRGQGVGGKLVEAAAKRAYAQGLKVNPLCSFARAVFDKTPEYDDVRA